MPELTAIYLHEQRVSSLQQDATLADEFAFTYKSPYKKSKELCFFCGKSNCLVADCLAWKWKQQGLAPKQSQGVGFLKTSP